MKGWVSINTGRPKIGNTVLIFEQGYGIYGNYYSDYRVALYTRANYNKRKTIFIPPEQSDETTPWEYRAVTHWRRLPESPAKVDKEEFMRKAGYIK